MRRHIYILFILFFAGQMMAQSTIQLKNPSFEDVPGRSDPPWGWKNCGFIGESPPDVHPASDSVSYWEVQQKAQEGHTFLGMVVRDNETYERVAQYLPTPLKGGECYEMSIYLCRSAVYESQSRKTNKMANYNEPAVLRVYGGQSICDTREVLYETRPIANTNWEQYTMEFKPSLDCKVLILEAFYKTPSLYSYNGNVLLDNASSIEHKPCPEEIISMEDPKEDTKTSSFQHRSTKRIGNKKPEKVKSYKKPEILKELNIHTIEEGQTIRISNLHFKADSSNVTGESEKVLKEIYHFMDYYPNVKLEIGGHTNLRPKREYARDLSLERAESVVNYLVKKGIDEARLESVGYGNTKPLIKSHNKIANKINQRVEIKVLSLDGEEN
jgi:outer membrane protein OmpA-like peptidoglycan-associated protein